MNRYQDILDIETRQLLSLDTDFEDLDISEENLSLTERFRGETEDEAYYRQAMEMFRGRAR